MTFKDIHGNEAVVSALRGMVDSGRIPHAMLLHENDGGGAVPIVLAFIRYLYCRNRHDGDACCACPACNRTAKLIHPDVHFVYPVTTGSRAGTDKPTSESYLKYWRELVTENPYFFEGEMYAAFGIEGKSGNIAVAEAKSVLDRLSLSAVEGGYRTVVVYLPEKMNLQAANTLLKMVEEPPENTLFLMVTHDPEKVLKTIYSRCLFMRVLPLSREDEHRFHPEEGAELQAHGDLFADLMNALMDKDLMSALEAGEAMAALSSREKQKSFCKFASAGMRKVFLLQQKLPALADLREDERPFYEKMAASFKKTFPRNAMTQIDRAAGLLERNVNQKIIFTDLVDRLYRNL